MIEARVVGSTQGPTALGRLSLPFNEDVLLEPFGTVPIRRQDMATLLRTIADEMDGRQTA